MKTTVFGHVTPGSLVNVYKRFGGCAASTFRMEERAECVKWYTYCERDGWDRSPEQTKGKGSGQNISLPISVPSSSTLKMEEARCCEMSVNI
jgi:hypothetical protein